MRLYFYYAMFPLGLACAVSVSLLCSGKSALSSKKAAIYTFTGFLSGVLGAMLISIPYNLFLDAVYGSGAHGVSKFSLFGALIFMPVLIKLFTLKNSDPYNEIMDVCSSGVYAVLALGKLGCSVYGCCGGVESESGPVNPLTGERAFPVQMCEALFCLLLLVLGIVLSRRLKKRGLVYPLLLSAYSAGRFFFQFLRAGSAEERTFTGFADFWQCACILTFSAGIILILYKTKIQKTVSLEE